MTNKPSKVHHFLPRHYLKGFTNNSGSFFLYDKLSEKIFESSPGNAFFEKKLNTVTFPKGNTSDFLEEMYAHIENASWDSLDKIRNSSKTTEIDPSDKMALFFFLLCLHWRLPANMGVVENLSNIAFNEDGILNYFTISNKDGKKAPQNILDEIKSSSAFKKSLKIILPFAPFSNLRNNEWNDDVGRWRFLYPADGKSWYIVGDNPIVTMGINDHDPLKCLKEFVFPISGKILLVNTNPPICKGIPPELVIKCNIAIIERAKRFVASPNRDWLETLVQFHKFYKSFNKTNTIIPEFFEGIKSEDSPQK